VTPPERRDMPYIIAAAVFLIGFIIATITSWMLQ
jgi:hypothetical protein